MVHHAEDLERIEPADPRHPSLVETLDALERVVSEVGDEVDVLHTVFSPLSVLGILAGGIGEPLLTMAKQDPERVDRALEAVRETVVHHARDALDRGAAGLFYAPTQWTSLDVCDVEAYTRFGRPHDLWVLDRVRDARFSALHVCGNHVEMERFLDYPVELLSWDDRGAGNPSMSELARRTDKALMAGVPHRRIHKLPPDALEAAVRGSVGGLDAGFVVAGGCAVGALLDDERMRAVRDLVEALG